MQLSYDQVYALARNAGFTPDQAVIMTAISEPESGRNPGAQNLHDNHDTQWSMGLWQISTGRKTVPDPNWSDPFVNARLAFQKFKGGGFRPWGTYNTGKYLSFLDEARAAQQRTEHNLRITLESIPHGKNAIQKGIDAVKSIPGNVVDAVTDPVANAIGTFQTELKKVAFTGLFTAAGIGLVVVGLVQLVGPTIKRSAKQAVGIGASVATKGAV